MTCDDDPERQGRKAVFVHPCLRPLRPCVRPCRSPRVTGSHGAYSAMVDRYTFRTLFDFLTSNVIPAARSNSAAARRR